MQTFARSAGGLLRRPAVGSISALPGRRWDAPLARRDDPLMAAHPKGNLHRLCRFACGPMLDFGVKSEKKRSNQGYARKETKPSSAVEAMQSAIMERTQNNLIKRATEEVTCRPTEEVTERNPTAANHICSPTIFPNSSHRDGAIYNKETNHWKNEYFDVITNRNETRVEPMRFSVATNCNPDPENCLYHSPCIMVQIFSLKLAKAPINNGLIQLYGYLAARDDVDSMLNYIFYRTRDDPIIVQQGSHIEMTGPKRGIALVSEVMFEFDMRIKNGEKEEDDLQLIDGLTELYEMEMLSIPITFRINGNSSAVDMSLMKVYHGVEATVEVVISEVQNGFDLSLSSVVSTPDVPEEFQLFCGHIGESCGLRRFVMAVSLDTVMHLKFQVDKKGSDVDEHCCSFESKLHGCASHHIKLELASISVKVTWSTLE